MQSLKRAFQWLAARCSCTQAQPPRCNALRHQAQVRSSAGPDPERPLELPGGDGSPAAPDMVIGDLPDDILLEVLFLVPAKDLILNCRLVCSRWRDLVDLPLFWKWKGEKRGLFQSQPSHQGAHDWRTFYFCCIRNCNLFLDPYGRFGFIMWDHHTKDSGYGNFETLTKDPRGTARPRCSCLHQDQPQCHTYFCEVLHIKPSLSFFVSARGPCTKSQVIDLSNKRYADELLDEMKPKIVVTDWFRCGQPEDYRLQVKLLAADHKVLQELDPKDVIVKDWRANQWTEASYVFRKYPSGVRYIYFEHGSQSQNTVSVMDSSITIGKPD